MPRALFILIRTLIFLLGLAVIGFAWYFLLHHPESYAFGTLITILFFFVNVGHWVKCWQKEEYLNFLELRKDG